MHVGEPIVAALGAVGEFCVVKAKQVEQRGVEIVDVHRIGNGVESEIVGCTVHVAPLDAASGQPHRKGAVVVIAAVVAILHHRRSPELATPHHDRVVQEAPLLQVGDQRGARLVGIDRVCLDRLREIAVLVPRLVKELHKPHSAFQQPAGKQAVAGKTGLRRIVDPVAGQHLLRLIGEIHQLRSACLEFVRHLVALDPRCNLGIANVFE